MVDTKQLDAVLAEWRDATTPLDAKMSVDPSFFFPSSSSSSSSRRLALQRQASTSTALQAKQEEQHNGASDALTLRAELLEKSCRPWNHEDFLRRVSSFSIGTWFAKPDAISVFACARHGWINTSQPDQLYCPCCEQYLCFKIDPKLSEKGVLHVASAFAKLLATGHSQLCPWRENPSPEAFTTLPIASPEQVLASLEKRIERFLAAISAATTTMQLVEFVRSLQIDASVTAKLLGEVSGSSEALQTHADPESDSESTSEALKTELKTKFEDLVGANVHEANRASRDGVAKFLLNVALLSVCGWQLEEKDSTDEKEAMVAWCDACNRRWSLWSFASSSSSSSSTTVESDDGVERSAKRQKVAREVVAIDPVSQHRWFCPWVAARKLEASHERGVMSDELAKYGENDAKLWEFMLLPGWRQYAQALRLMVSSSALSKKQKNGDGHDDAKSRTEPQDTPSHAARPEQALESVRAVLGLPGW